MKDRKGEMIQETIPTVQTTENENPNGVQGGRERERSSKNKRRRQILETVWDKMVTG